MHWNAEGIYNKKSHFHKRLTNEDIDIACVQETHLKPHQRFSVRGYQVFRQDREERTKGGILTLVKNSIPAKEIIINTDEQAELQGVNFTLDNKQFVIYNAYCPSNKKLCLEKMDLKEEQCIVVGDFNSHSEAWGYAEADQRGEEVEDWQWTTDSCS